MGFGLAFLIGPAFFALLQASISHGFGVSVALALGVVASDCVLMTISYLVLSQVGEIPYFHEGLAIVGGLVLMITGITSIVRKPPDSKPIKFTVRESWPIFRRGFRINTYNPFPWMFWLSTSELVHAGIGRTSNLAAFLFFSIAAITVFSTDALKAWAAQFILKYLNPPVIRGFAVVSGICLFGFGLNLLWFAFNELQKSTP